MPPKWVEQQLQAALEHRQQLAESIASTLQEIELADRVIEVLSGERPAPPLGTAPATLPLVSVPVAPPPAPEPEPPAAPTANIADQVLAYIREHGPVARAEVGDEFDIRGGQLTRAIDTLVETVGLERVKGPPSPTRPGRAQLFLKLPEQEFEEYEPEPEAPEAPPPEPAPEAPPAPKARRYPDGAEALPTHLRAFPVAHSDIPVARRVAAAELQLKTLQHLDEGVSTAPLMAQRDTGSPNNEQPDAKLSGRYGRTLRDLHTADLVARVGTQYGPWQSPEGGPLGGRPSARYRITNAGRAILEQVVAPPTEPAPTPITLEAVRNTATAMEGLFSPSQVAAKLRETADTDVPQTAIEEFLATLAERGVLLNESPTSDQPLYRYERPTGPGRAAELDRERRPTTAVGGNGGAAPVAGTGRAERAPRADVDSLLRAARKAGAEVERTGGDHFLVKLNGRRAVIAGTPSSGGLQRDKLKLRSIGVPV